MTRYYPRDILPEFLLVQSATIRVLGCFCALAIAFSAQAQRAHPALHSNGVEGSIARGEDHVQEREAWFQAGRAVHGENAAALLNRAYRQKQKMQAAQLQSAAQQAGAQQTGAAALSAQSWTPLGPSPTIYPDYGAVTGRVTALEVDPKDATGNTIYVGAAYGGVWRSTNAATANPSSVLFQPLIEDQPTLAVGAIALHPTQNVILIGTGEPNSSAFSYYGMGILRSGDGGNSWTLIRDADNHTHPFAGLGFSAIAFNQDSPNVVVASVGTTNGQISGAEQPGAMRGLYYSTDTGATWQSAAVSGLSGDTGSATDVIYNRVQQRFYAVIRGHGYYYSTDGASWTRLEAQPTADLAAANCGAGANFITCPIYRGSLTVKQDSGELYTVFVDSAGNTGAAGGIFRLTVNAGTPSWTVLGQAGIDACGDAGGGCGTEQGVYNLYVRAVPSGTGTDLYMGAVNIFKCHLDPAGDNTCSTPGAWKNLTHAYGCAANGTFGSPGHVHPDQHAMAISIAADHYFAFFGNDGGVNRSLSADMLSSSSCTAPDLFDNLNAALESFSQFVDFSQDPADMNIVLGGLQDNGSPSHSAAGGATWQTVNTGDGGYNAIDPVSSNNWYTSTFGVSIQRCTAGASCLPSMFSDVVLSSTLGSDTSAFYMPFLLDPANATKLLLGTCRIWRVGGDGTGADALSPNFSSGDSTPCSGDTFSGSTKIRAVTAGGPSLNSNSQVIYAGMVSRVLPVAGHVFVSTNAAGAAPTWADRTAGINPAGFDISNIFADPHDLTGGTAFVTVMGFTGGGGHVWKTTDFGANWTDISVGLPDAPANSVIVDPRFANQIYVGNDVGVFSSFDGGTSWEVLGSGLPSVPAVRLEAFLANGSAKLRVATYGRGLFETALPTTGVNLNPSGINFSNAVPGFATAEQTVVLGNNRSTALAIASVTSSSEFPITANSCTGTIPGGGACSVSLHFSPQAVGSRSGTLQILADDSSTAHSASLIGTGVDFALILSRPARPRRGSADIVLTSGASVSVPFTLRASGDLPAGVTAAFSCKTVRALRCVLDRSVMEASGTATLQITPVTVHRAARFAAAGNRARGGIFPVTVTARIGTLVRFRTLTVEIR